MMVALDLTCSIGAMDDLLPPCYPPFLESFAGDDGQHQYPALEFLSCDVLEKWLLGNDDALDKNSHDDEDPQDANSIAIAGACLPAAAAPLAWRKRGRKPGSGGAAAGGTSTTTLSHVEAERQRRDRLKRLFCGLRAAVPTVTGMDRESLLADAVGYIAELRGRVVQLEADAEARRAAATSLSQYSLPLIGGQELEVRMQHGWDAAALRLTTTTAAPRHRHAPARLMAALRALDLPVQHACVCRVGCVTVQDVVVDVPAAGFRGDDCLRTALMHKLLQESG